MTIPSPRKSNHPWCASPRPLNPVRGVDQPIYDYDRSDAATRHAASNLPPILLLEGIHALVHAEESH